MKRVLLLSLISFPVARLISAQASAAVTKPAQAAAPAVQKMTLSEVQILSYKETLESAVSNWKLFEVYGQPLHNGTEWLDMQEEGSIMAAVIASMHGTPQQDAAILSVYKVLAKKIQTHANPGLPPHIFEKNRNIEYLKKYPAASQFATAHSTGDEEDLKNKDSKADS